MMGKMDVSSFYWHHTEETAITKIVNTNKIIEKQESLDAPQK